MPHGTDPLEVVRMEISVTVEVFGIGTFIGVGSIAMRRRFLLKKTFA